MEFFVEMFITILFEGLLDAQGNAKIPKWLRVVFAALMCWPWIVIFSIIAIKNLDNTFAMIFFSLLAVALMILYAFLCYKIITNRGKRDN